MRFVVDSDGVTTGTGDVVRPANARPPRALSGWAGGVIALLLVYGPFWFAVLLGISEDEKPTWPDQLLLVFALLPLIAFALAAPLYGARRFTVFCRLCLPIIGLEVVWNRGIAAAEAVNRSVERGRST